MALNNSLNKSVNEARTDNCETEEQRVACQVRSIFKNNRLTEIEIGQLRREIEKVEIAPERVGTVSEMSYGRWSVTETIREQGCD